MSAIRIPEGYPPSRGEQTFTEWYNNNYPLLVSETELERLTRLFPKKTPDESFPNWARRLAKDPVLCQALTTWPHPEVDVQSVSLRRADGALIVDYLGHIELEKFWKAFGYFMDLRMNAAIRMCLLPPQFLVTKGRYGIGFLEKNVAHCALRFLGIKAAFCVDTRNQSFHFTNSVLPSESGIISAAIEEVYNARPRGGQSVQLTGRKIWAVQITGSVNNKGNGVAVLTHTLSKSSASPGDPEAGFKIKWQHYNAIISAQIERPGRMIIRGFISPEVFVLCGFYPMVSHEQLVAAGFENGVPEALEKYPGVLRGQCEDRKHGEYSTDPRARNREVKQIYMTWDQLLPILWLLRKLEGFDESRILINP